jgi:long-subunit fatty acid transport protein
MGGAFIGLADDATAAEANPAGLTILTKPEVSFEYRNTVFDNEFLNSFNPFVPGQAEILSDNNIDDVNQLSFLSVVFPSSRLTFGVSRQEVLNVQGNIDETLQITLLTDTGPVNVNFASRANVDENVVNYNFSAASKLSDTFSLGVSVRYSKLEWKSRVENFAVLGSQSLPAFQTAINDSDSQIAYNIGALWNTGKFSLGGVYKKNPKFEVQGVETGQLAQKPGAFKNVFKIPDTYGVGVAVKPNDSITLSADYVRVEYSDLLEGFEAGFNIFTDLLTNADITYKIDDANEFHIGTEFVVFMKSVPIALRQGYYRRPANSLVVDRLNPAFEDSRRFLDAIFNAREDENHFTFGAGAVFGPHFQVDWGFDIANTSDSFILSSVVRF